MKDPYIRLFVRDWLCSRRVLSMSGDAVKAYIYLLCEAWLQEPRATLPNDDDELASLSRLNRVQFDKIKHEIMQHFKVGECEEHLGLLYNDRLLEESLKRENNQRFNNKNAKKSRIKHKVNAAPEHEHEYENGINSLVLGKDHKEGVLSQDGAVIPHNDATWRTSFEIYKKEAEAAFDALYADWEWIEQKKVFYPGMCIRLSLDKMWQEYWGTEAGWVKKKAKKMKSIDWKRTIENGLSMACNRVFFKKGETDWEEMEIKKQCKEKRNEPTTADPKNEPSTELIDLPIL